MMPRSRVSRAAVFTAWVLLGALGCATVRLRRTSTGVATGPVDRLAAGMIGWCCAEP